MWFADGIGAIAEGVARALRFGAVLVLIGAGVRHLFDRAGSVALAPVVRLVRVAAVTVVATCLLQLWWQARAFVSALGEVPRMVVSLLQLPWGMSWMVQCCFGLLLAAWPASVAARPTSTGGILRVLLIVGCVAAPLAFQGHAAGSADFTYAAILADTAHVVAAGAWLGSLAVIVIGARNSSSSALFVMLRAFSPVALTSAAIVAMTGAFGAWLQVRIVSAVLQSTYGRVLLFKVAAVGCVVALGALNWRRHAAQTASAADARRLLRSATAELVIAAVVVAITAFLVTLPSPST